MSLLLARSTFCQAASKVFASVGGAASKTLASGRPRCWQPTTLAAAVSASSGGSFSAASSNYAKDLSRLFSSCSLSSSALSSSRPSLLSSSTMIDSTVSHYQMTSKRSFGWTKQKIKRVARAHKRKEMIRKKIPPQLPPDYKDPNMHVAGSKSHEFRKEETKEFDERVAEEIRQRRVELANDQKGTLRLYMSESPDLKMSDRVRKLFELHNGSQREVVQAQKRMGMRLFQLREADTGSSAVQVVALTSRIQQMQTHMASHHKDRHGKRGLDRMYVRRRKLLQYMERTNFEGFRKVIKTLGLQRH